MDLDGLGEIKKNVVAERTEHREGHRQNKRLEDQFLRDFRTLQQRPEAFGGLAVKVSPTERRCCEAAVEIAIERLNIRCANEVRNDAVSVLAEPAEIRCADHRGAGALHIT